MTTNTSLPVRIEIAIASGGRGFLDQLWGLPGDLSTPAAEYVRADLVEAIISETEYIAQDSRRDKSTFLDLVHKVNSA